MTRVAGFSTLPKDDQDKDIINQMVADGFKIYVEERPLTVLLSEFQSQELRYRDEGFQIVGYYEIIDNSPERIVAEINRLKSELTATDYQIIKSYEYVLAGEQSPYDITELHFQRCELRGQINNLENKI